MAEDSSITREDLLKLRSATGIVAERIEADLRAHLEALASLLRPKLLLGDLISGEGSESRGDPEAAHAKLMELFRSVCQRPFRLSPNLPKPLPAIRVRLDLHPFETDEFLGDANKKLTVVSPFAWVVSYPGACNLGNLRRMLDGDEERDEDEIRSFVLNSCILHFLIEDTPRIIGLLEALRFTLSTEKLPGLGDLPVPVVRSAIPSTRPSAQLMLEAAAMAGLSSFGELIDVSAAKALADPVQELITRALGAAG